MMKRAWLVLLAAAACHKSEARRVCEQAAAKYSSCMRELLGLEAEAMARGKDGTAACARDDKTVAMYRACLPKSGCTVFLDCLERYTRDSQPAISTTAPRRAQCEQHGKDGFRGVGMAGVI